MRRTAGQSSSWDNSKKNKSCGRAQILRKRGICRQPRVCLRMATPKFQKPARNPMSLFDLSGKVALVTGSTKGIGEAIVHRLAEHGAKVVVSSRKADACEKVAGDINKARGAKVALPIPC